MKIFLEQTTIGHSSNIRDYGNNVKKFLIDNADRIVFNQNDEEKLLNTHDPLTHTLMSELYKQALFEKKLGIIKPIILDKIDKIPSWFLISWLDIDTLILGETDKSSAQIINTISEFRNKILVDITPFYNDKSRMIKDTGNFYSRIIRNLLCRSYHTNSIGWLTPSIIYILTKLYATIISTRISRVYNLSYQEQLVIMTILAVYFTNKCYNNDKVIQPVMGKMDFIRSVDTKNIFEHIEEKYNVHNFDMKAVIELIKELGPARLNNFNISTFFNMYMNITSNQSVSLLALEYPPYWAHAIFSALSGDKTNLYFSIKSLHLDRDSITLKNEMTKTSSFILSL